MQATGRLLGKQDTNRTPPQSELEGHLISHIYSDCKIHETRTFLYQFD
jgi:hypothetical protein